MQLLERVNNTLKRI